MNRISYRERALPVKLLLNQEAHISDIDVGISKNIIIEFKHQIRAHDVVRSALGIIETLFALR